MANCFSIWQPMPPLLLESGVVGVALGVEWALWGVTGLVSLPIAMLAIECLVGGLLPGFGRSPSTAGWRRPRVAVLIPAHNEAASIGTTIQAIQPQLQPGDRLLVVADNCTDATAELARSAGADVAERFNTEQRGKGYALDFGVRVLAQEPPEVVVIVDADCTLEPGSLDRLGQWALKHNRPVQGRYLMELPPSPSAARRVSAFAFAVKNFARSEGLRRLGLPCLLNGTGMAFPWQAIAQLPLASGNLVEDMQMGIDLTVAGSPPLFCPDAPVTGRLPQAESAATSQRTRWEHGHLQTMISVVPPLLGRAIRTGNGPLLVMGLDLLVPPLSFLVMIWVGAVIAVTGLGALVGRWQPAIGMGVLGLVLFGAIGLAWWRVGRPFLSARMLLMIPIYVLQKVPIYLGFLKRRQTEWVRTERD
ncbi:glycosyltransferase family 2 protein [Limnothrix sp. PR1529]|uniref:glycosyltransferase family 2 protein n=1 Tax=Limnothrix sp. PR1529 TaxID=1704291 RepID=UPI000ADBB0C8|nr:glycosyltransferase family 2 protein [Limnothrix sp. PR1529]